MRAAAIFGLRGSPKNLEPFQIHESVEWLFGMPAAANQAEVILIFGGDGTVHRHLGQLVKLALPVLVVPVGSGNDFARALGLRNVRDSIAAWRRFCAGQDNIRAIDLGVITPLANAGGVPAPHESTEPRESAHYYCCVAGVGLDAEVTRRANSLPRWLRRHGGYALAVAPVIFRFAAVAVKIFASDKCGEYALRSNQLTMLAAFANTPTYGGGMKIVPEARMDDGQLDVCVIGGINRLKLFCMFPTVYFGGHLGIRAVDYFHASRLRVETETPLDLYADGEFVCRTPLEVSVHPGALRVLTP